MQHAQWLMPLQAGGNLSRQGTRSLAVMACSQALRLLLNVVSIVILARLIMPADFGLMAMALTVTNFMFLFKDMGMTTSTIQQHTITQQQVSTLFWVNMLVGVVMAGVTAASAPLLAHFYGQPLLVPITLVMAAGFVFGGLSAQHDALMRRRLMFTRVAGVEVASQVVAMLVAVVMAWRGFGWWALVAQRMAQVVVYAVGCWVMCSWRPSFAYAWSGVRSQVAFGAHISFSNLATYFSRNGDNILVGWYWGPALLGIYSKAYDLLVNPLFQIATPLANVMVPLLGHLRDHPQRYRNAYTRVVTLGCLVAMPVGAVLFMLAEDVVAVIFGKGWEAVGPVLMWFGVVLVTQMLSVTMAWLLISQQRGKDYAFITLINASINMAGFAGALAFGITAMAMVYALLEVALRQPLAFWLVSRKGPVRMADIYGNQRFSLLGAGLVLPLLLLVRLYVPGAPLVRLGLGVAVALAGTLLVVALCAEGRALLRHTFGMVVGAVKKEAAA